MPSNGICRGFSFKYGKFLPPPRFLTALSAAIRAVRKPDVLNDYEVCRYMRLENGLSADVYSLEIIIPIAFRLNTYHAHVFRTWLVGKALSKEKRQAYVMFIQNGKAGYC